MQHTQSYTHKKLPVLLQDRRFFSPKNTEPKPNLPLKQNAPTKETHETKEEEEEEEETRREGSAPEGAILN